MANNNKKVLHIYPDDGGLNSFGKVMDQILRPVYNISPFTVSDSKGVFAQLSVLKQQTAERYLVEIGSPIANHNTALIAMLLPKNVPMTVILHDPNPHKPKGLRGRWRFFVLKQLLKKAEYRISLNPAHTYLFGLPLKTMRHPMWQEKPPKLRTKSHTRPQVLFSGYWSEEKGLATLMDAIGILNKRRGKDAEFTLAGSGFKGSNAFVDEISQRAATVPNIFMPGRIAENAMDEMFSKADVVVVPYWPELAGGSSGTVTRALASGAVIVASQTPSLSTELSLYDAVFAEPKDAQSLAEALEKALAKLPGFGSHGKRQQATAFEQASWSKTLTNMADYL